MRDRILVTGATGKTGRRTLRQLQTLGLNPMSASRHGSDGSVAFDWHKPDSFATALDKVRAVYLVAPPGEAEALAAMQPFLEQALAAGVSRFVLLSASSLEEGRPAMGQVHAWLRHHAPEWVVLRPTWFMQNFSEGPHQATICATGTILSATGTGRLGFIDAEDIAAVAARMLSAPEVPNGEVLLTGPETLTYSDVARLIGSARGQPVVHRNLSQTALRDRHISDGIPPAFATLLAEMDTQIAAGSEDRVTREVERITGQPARSFASFAKDAAAVWTPLLTQP